MSRYLKAHKLSLLSALVISFHLSPMALAQSGNQIPSTGASFSTYEQFIEVYNSEPTRQFNLKDVFSRLKKDSLTRVERADIRDKVNQRKMPLKLNQGAYDNYGRPRHGQGSGLAGNNNPSDDEDFHTGYRGDYSF